MWLQWWGRVRVRVCQAKPTCQRGCRVVGMVVLEVGLRVVVVVVAVLLLRLPHNRRLLVLLVVLRGVDVGDGDRHRVWNGPAAATAVAAAAATAATAPPHVDSVDSVSVCSLAVMHLNQTGT